MIENTLQCIADILVTKTKLDRWTFMLKSNEQEEYQLTLLIAT